METMIIIAIPIIIGILLQIMIDNRKGKKWTSNIDGTT